MKYLVIGDSNSMHIYNFVRTVLLPQNYQVHLLTLSTSPVREEYRSFYKENGVVLHSVCEKNYKGLNKKDVFHRALNLFRKTRLMADVPKVDICHVQSVYKTSLALVVKNKRKFDKLILSYWGSDIRELSPAVLKLREKCFEMASVITVTVEQLRRSFCEIHGDKYNDKLQICRFATSGLDCIKKLSETITRQNCRESYNISADKICVTCGYSATSEQHQDEILKELQKLPAELKEKLYVIVPMQYGRNDNEYIRRVEQEKNTCDFDCVILDEYVPFEMSAKLAIATDIYLHLRDTDAFSNALKEHVYAGSDVITGEWLKYIELEQMNAPFESVSSIDCLADALEKKLENFEVDKEIDLFQPIYEMYSTENIIKQWKGVIDSALK